MLEIFRRYLLDLLDAARRFATTRFLRFRERLARTFARSVPPRSRSRATGLLDLRFGKKSERNDVPRESSAGLPHSASRRERIRANHCINVQRCLVAGPSRESRESREIPRRGSRSPRRPCRPRRCSLVYLANASFPRAIAGSPLIPINTLPTYRASVVSTWENTREKPKETDGPEWRTGQIGNRDRFKLSLSSRNFDKRARIKQTRNAHPEI